MDAWYGRHVTPLPPPPHSLSTQTPLHSSWQRSLSHLRLVATVGQQLAPAAHRQVQLQLRLALLLGGRAVLAQRQIHCSNSSSSSNRSSRMSGSSKHTRPDLPHATAIRPSPHTRLPACSPEEEEEDDEKRSACSDRTAPPPLSMLVRPSGAKSRPLGMLLLLPPSSKEAMGARVTTELCQPAAVAAAAAVAPRQGMRGDESMSKGCAKPDW